MRTISLLVITGLFFSLALPIANAEGADPYADSVYQASNQTYFPDGAIGAPDQTYAQFFAKDASLILDMGEGEEGVGDVTLSYAVLDFGAAFRMEFKDENFTTLQSYSATWQVTTSQITIDYTATSAYRYVGITSMEEEVWKLDAVEAESYETPEADMGGTEETPASADASAGEEEAEESTEIIEEPDIRGMLVKLPDDGNAETSFDTAVYVLDEAGVRHAFPTESVFGSWWENFEDVEVVESDVLAGYALLKNVTVRPGTSLVKIVSDPRVYAVEPDGILRWITSETIARTLYGDAWASRVVDVPDGFFANYTQGENLTTAVHPDGTMGVWPSGEAVYISNAMYYSLSVDVYDFLRIQPQFLVTISEDIAAFYVDGGELEPDATIAFPF
jgi:hypothetical protein